MNTLLVCHLGEAKVQRQGAELDTKLLAFKAAIKQEPTELTSNQQDELG
ncbi:hypothetical protein [Vibrio gallaecicus]|uniref:Uncharacterized protein n=1 Tax=Vibrio gallaecicus TaxID=552386 RepID=A0ABV4NHB4_9VIBR